MKRHEDLADFCFLGSDASSRLTALERLTITGGRELEKALGWISKQFDTLINEKFLQGIEVGDLDLLIKDYRSSNWLSDPELFFKPEKRAPLVQVTPVHGLSDGIIEDLQFLSRFSAHHSFAKPFREECPENEIVHVRLWRHEIPPKGTIIAVHGWTMGDQRINSLAFMPGHFYKLGFDVALIELPYHGRRQPKNKFPISPVLTTDGIGQAISDLRSLRQYLRSIGRSEVGVIGMSLGGYLASLWAELDQLSFVIPIVPLVSLAELEWEMVTKQPNFDQVKSKGFTLELLRELYSFHCPLSHTLKTDKGKALIIAGLGDAVVPARQPKMLWDHWKRPQIQWLTGGHVAQFKRAKVFEDITIFLKNLGFVTQL